METVLIGVIDFTEAKRMKSLLEERGVKLELRMNPDTCTTGGCKPTVEVFAPQAGMEEIAKFFQEERSRNFAGLQADHALTQEVFDTERETAKCPACGTEFSTRAAECPDCGLCFSAE